MNQEPSDQSKKISLVLGDEAPDVRLADHAGQPILLSSLWRSQPRVLLFIRHFG